MWTASPCSHRQNSWVGEPVLRGPIRGCASPLPAEPADTDSSLTGAERSRARPATLLDAMTQPPHTEGHQAPAILTRIRVWQQCSAARRCAVQRQPALSRGHPRATRAAPRSGHALATPPPALASWPCPLRALSSQEPCPALPLGLHRYTASARLHVITATSAKGTTLTARHYI